MVEKLDRNTDTARRLDSAAARDRRTPPVVLRAVRGKYRLGGHGWLRTWCDRHGVNTSYEHSD